VVHQAHVALGRDEELVVVLALLVADEAVEDAGPNDLLLELLHTDPVGLGDRPDGFLDRRTLQILPAPDEHQVEGRLHDGAERAAATLFIAEHHHRHHTEIEHPVDLVGRHLVLVSTRRHPPPGRGLLLLDVLEDPAEVGSFSFELPELDALAPAAVLGLHDDLGLAQGPLQLRVRQVHETTVPTLSVGWLREGGRHLTGGGVEDRNPLLLEHHRVPLASIAHAHVATEEAAVEP
jgi:hypothetical protein